MLICTFTNNTDITLNLSIKFIFNMKIIVFQLSFQHIFYRSSVLVFTYVYILFLRNGRSCGQSDFIFEFLGSKLVKNKLSFYIFRNRKKSGLKRLNSQVTLKQCQISIKYEEVSYNLSTQRKSIHFFIHANSKKLEFYKFRFFFTKVQKK